MTEQTDNAFQNAIDNIAKLKAGGEVEPPEVEEELHEIELDDGEELETAAEEEVEAEEGDKDDVSEALTHGYLPYDEYVEAGNDPDMYRGPKAFVQFKEMKEKLRGEVKQEQGETEKLRADMDDMMKMFIDSQKERKAEEKKALEAALAAATEELDPKAAAEIATKIARMGDDDTGTEIEAPAPQAKYTGSMAPLESLVSANPIIDRTSEDYNEDITRTFGARVDKRVNKSENLSESKLTAIIEQEWKKTQEIHGLVKPRITKKAPRTPGAKPIKQTAKRSVKLTPSEKALHDKLKASKPAAAAEYLKSVLERS